MAVVAGEAWPRTSWTKRRSWVCAYKRVALQCLNRWAPPRMPSLCINPPIAWLTAPALIPPNTNSPEGSGSLAKAANTSGWAGIARSRLPLPTTRRRPSVSSTSSTRRLATSQHLRPARLASKIIARCLEFAPSNSRVSSLSVTGRGRRRRSFGGRMRAVGSDERSPSPCAQRKKQPKWLSHTARDLLESSLPSSQSSTCSRVQSKPTCSANIRRERRRLSIVRTASPRRSWARVHLRNNSVSFLVSPFVGGCAYTIGPPVRPVNMELPPAVRWRGQFWVPYEKDALPP